MSIQTHIHTLTPDVLSNSSLQEPGIETQTRESPGELAFMLPVLKPGLYYAAPFPRRQGDGLTSPTEYLTPDPNKQEVRGEANSSSVLSEAL